MLDPRADLNPATELGPRRKVQLMDDPTRPEVGERLQVALREGSIIVPGLTDSAAVEVRALGAGESYAAWKVVDGSQAVVVRIPRRPPEEMPTSMQEELDASALIDGSVGSRALAIDDSPDNALGTPFIVSNYVPGTVRTAAQWNDALLMAHARQMAKLHDPRYEGAGAVGADSAAIDLVSEFDEGYGWWQESHPDVTDSDGVAALGAAVRKRLLDARPFFDGMRYSFIHGDLVATNVVVDRGGVPRFIDWEWARIGDVAQDLAYIGGTVVGGPWYVPMKPSTVKSFIAEYMATAAAQPHWNDESLERLQGRRHAWELYERFLSSLHFSKQARILDDPGFYPGAVRSLHATLRSRLGLDG